MIRIAICDDEIIFLDFMSTALKDIANKLNLDYEVDVFNNGELLLQNHIERPYDVMFLDIDMPKMTGFDIARNIRNKSLKTFIIFVTAKNDLVYSSFDYQPFSFICKNSNSLNNDLEKVFERLFRYYKQSRFIELTDSRIVTSVTINDIIYIQSDKHYLMYYTTTRDHDAPIRERNTILSKEKELIEYGFIQPHSRYLVNAEHIFRLDTILNTIVMDSGHQIPISKKYKKSVLDEYRRYTRR